MERLQVLLYDTSCSARLLYYYAHSCVESHEQLCPKFLQFKDAMRMYNEVVDMIRMQRSMEEREEAVREREEPNEGGRVVTEGSSGVNIDEARAAAEAEDRTEGQIAEARGYISDIQMATLQIGAYLAAEDSEL